MVYVRVITLSAIFYLACIHEACAYLDPGTGSYFFQIFIASILGVIFSIKTWRQALMRWFKRKR